MEIENENEIIKECQDFLTDSATAFGTDMARQTEQLEMFGGNFWTDNTKKTYRRTNKLRPNLHFSNWEVLKNASVSPFSRSPYHIALEDTMSDKDVEDPFGLGLSYDDVQKGIDKYEGDTDCKVSYLDALGRAYVCGNGFYVLGVEQDELTNQNKICGEFVVRQESVAFDPNANNVDGSDAEQGAIVNYISLKKAKRLYGDGIVPMDYPKVQPTLSFVDNDQFPDVANKIQVVTYYRKHKVEGGATIVQWFKICGNGIIDSGELPIRYIPIVRFAGFATYRNGDIFYTGIVDKTFSLQLGINIAYSTLVERAGRSVKANFITNVESVSGLEDYYKKMNEDDSLLVMYKGEKAPIPINENFVTGDLSDMIANTRNLLSDVVGVPLTGINGINESNKTATEVLQQQANAESNVANFYQNAYKATRTIGRIVIELITGGKDLPFTLENGPAVISDKMKKQQELSVVAGLVPENMKALVAMHYLDTLKSDEAKSVKKDVVANLPLDIKVASEEPTDAVAIHELRRMQSLCEQMNVQIEELTKQNEELQKQYEASEMTLLNQREDRNLGMQRFMISEQNRMNLETAKLESQNAKAAGELALKNKQVNAEMQRTAVETEKTALETAEAVEDTLDAV